jgi:hypothetical protein
MAHSLYSIGTKNQRFVDDSLMPFTIVIGNNSKKIMFSGKKNDDNYVLDAQEGPNIRMTTTINK